jgi:ATP phosphoribosyltransferase regulatory subunit
MVITMKNFQQEESILSALTELYKSRGLKKYKPSCFEEYSLYLDNKDFLISKNVITFSGSDGKLLALRPDVTLSVLSRTKADFDNCEKLFYTEKVYRQTESGGEFKEISQTGVEVIGKVDLACQTEIVTLIIKTLAIISDSYLLDISHMGFVDGLISSFNVSTDDKREFYDLLRYKNLHDFEQLAARCNLTKQQKEAFVSIVSIGGNLDEAVKQAEKCAINQQMKDAVNELKELTLILDSLGLSNSININFSIINDVDYYNGIVFNGYIEGVPHFVLSGGRYDKLCEKFGKNAQAIGFALYLGQLERYFKNDRTEVDYLIIYDDDSQLQALKLANEYNNDGKKVRLARSKQKDCKCEKIIDLCNGGAGV